MFWRELVNRCGIQSDESGLQFDTRARSILAEAKSLSDKACGSSVELNRWMAIAKAKEMTWMQGLYFAVEGMRHVTTDKQSG